MSVFLELKNCNCYTDGPRNGAMRTIVPDNENERQISRLLHKRSQQLQIPESVISVDDKTGIISALGATYSSWILWQLNGLSETGGKPDDETLEYIVDPPIAP